MVEFAALSPVAPQTHAHETVLRMEGVSKRFQGRRVLRGVSLSADVGELILVRGDRGSGRTTLARLIAGQTQPDEGEIFRACPCAPPPGVSWGLVGGAPTMHGLDQRAATFGVSTADYAEAIAALMDEPRMLLGRYEALRGRDRAIVQYAAALLLPARLHVVDGRPLPTDAIARRRLLPLWRAARARAAVVWIAHAGTPVRNATPSAEYRLHEGRLAVR